MRTIPAVRIGLGDVGKFIVTSATLGRVIPRRHS